MVKYKLVSLGLALLILCSGQTLVASAPSVPIEEKSVEELVEHYFPENSALMKAVFMAESSLNENAKNYNCHYYNEDGIRCSASCTKADRVRAWSVDCGISQINVRGTTCPDELLDPAINIARAREKYDTEGLGAWVVYKTGKYKRYLKSS